MPRYYFDVDDGIPTVDDVGADFEDLDAAHLEALRLYGALIQETPERLRLMRDWHIDIRSDADGLLRRVSLVTTHQSLVFS